MSDFDALSAPPTASSLLEKSFVATQDSNTTKSPDSTEIKNPSQTENHSEQIPEIVRITWQLDAQIQPMTGSNSGALFTLHKITDLANLLHNLPDEELNDIAQAASESPDSLAALPFTLPQDGDDFLQQLARITWSSEIEGVAVCYETDMMLSAQDAANAPENPHALQEYIAKRNPQKEKSRFVVAVTREETWSLVHPRFTTDPEHIEQGTALVPDLLQLMTRNMNSETATKEE